MGWNDPEPNDAPSKPPGFFKKRFGGASTSRDIDERPLCINRSYPPVRREMDDSDEEERLRKLRRDRERNQPRCGTARIIQEEYDREERDKYPSGRISPPMLAKRREAKKGNEPIPILELWDATQRSLRPKR